MNYLKLVIEIDFDRQEALIVELMNLDFYGFEQHDDQLIAYVEKPRFNDSNREIIEQIVGAMPGARFIELGEVEEQNWNETWERSIKAQHIGSFLIRPTWSLEEPGPGQTLLEIDPKMSFGTGYHATTRLALRRIEKISCNNKTVLDAGTGTGILAIGALKQGAKYAVGFDIDPWCERNATENSLINEVSDRFDVRLGGFEVIGKNEQFDIVVANINRNVILQNLDQIIRAAVDGGTVCLTGLMDSDEAVIRKALASKNVEIITIDREEEWILFELKKQS